MPKAVWILFANLALTGAVAAQLPSSLRGEWTRDWIQRGSTQSNTLDIHYLQTPGFFADIRIPRDRSGLTGARWVAIPFLLAIVGAIASCDGSPSPTPSGESASSGDAQAVRSLGEHLRQVEDDFSQNSDKLRILSNQALLAPKGSRMSKAQTDQFNTDFRTAFGALMADLDSANALTVPPVAQPELRSY